MRDADTTLEDTKRQRRGEGGRPCHGTGSTVSRSPWKGLPAAVGTLVTMLCLVCAGAAEPPSPMVRIGFSTKTIGNVNENDAIAAMRVWAQAVAIERGIPADPQPVVFRSVSEISTALTHGSVDCINLTTGEYAMLRGQLAEDSIVVGVKSDSITEQFVLLVHRDGAIEKMNDLRGRRIGLLDSSDTGLAPAWLDTVLAREGLAPASDFFGQIASVGKIGKAVLPVFFRQMDACIVTLKGFNTMVELNPQIGGKLKILAASRPLVTVVFCFRADYKSPLREKLSSEIAQWHHSVAGRQILTVFQIDRLEEHTVRCLDSALELLAEHSYLSRRPETVPERKFPGKPDGQTH